MIPAAGFYIRQKLFDAFTAAVCGNISCCQPKDANILCIVPLPSRGKWYYCSNGIKKTSGIEKFFKGSRKVNRRL